MGGKRRYRARDYAVGEQLLALRMRAELRQAELAALLQVASALSTWGARFFAEEHGVEISGKLSHALHSSRAVKDISIYQSHSSYMSDSGLRFTDKMPSIV